MRKSDYLFLLVVVILFLPFLLSPELYAGYKAFYAAHGMVMSFLKFAILSMLGECLGLRISTGFYNRAGFGIIPRMVIWGILGIGINMGMTNAVEAMSGSFSLDKFWVALCISLGMNGIFAPVFMTFHKITDTHILQCGGSVKSLLTPIPMTQIITHLNWDVQWNFVFKNTIPFFWVPAHTITFLLPEEARVLFAALLGVVLGILLAVAARKK